MQGVSLQNVFCLLVWAFHLAFSQNQGQGRYGTSNEFQGLLTAMETGLENDEHPFYSLTPSTPMPENINCYVEIPATRVGGQCVQMGSPRRRGRGGGNRSNRRRTPMIWGCQAGFTWTWEAPTVPPPPAARATVVSGDLHPLQQKEREEEEEEEEEEEDKDNKDNNSSHVKKLST